MYGVNHVLVKVVQQDHLREAKARRISRLWDARRKITQKVQPKGKA